VKDIVKQSAKEMYGIRSTQKNVMDMPQNEEMPNFNEGKGMK
jgi:hypothetical protein